MKILKIKTLYSDLESPPMATETELNAWLEENANKGNLGKKAYSEEIEVSPAVFDENGVELSPAKFETKHHPAQYTVTLVDITENLEKEQQEQDNRDFLKYLADTDYYIIRELETGVKAPKEIKDARKLAREKVKR